MPTRRTRLLLVVLLGVLMTLTAPLASAQTTAPSGPEIVAPQVSGDAKSKLVVGITAAVLLGIVVYGNRVRAKRKKG
ncbi:hypothetical protein [Actinokineospora sp. NBRC 105648]|uniref:hypothetical protein n=1 Tax=Actinokineospora sp. NBRC 105648 TaxID=3032206 RepID=UPI0024A12C61|nr:hypothetical protein [Actinokineospora sp. NBRC 105648]GLZ38582.1 hypothetical protein Acsp05_22060 [Actinokineospora sp. NBRC 105648]